MKKTMMILIALSLLTPLTATAEDFWTPKKTQVFSAKGIAMVDGNTVADVTVAGVATIHKTSPKSKFFLRPFAAIGQSDVRKAGVGTFEIAQVGALVGYQATPRLALLGGASVTALFPDMGTEYRPTLNAAAAFNLKKLDSGMVQIIAPLALNETPNGRTNLVASVGVAFVF